mmetsp:Transcript_33035/g.97466  ORF Transcript_33035/g.97466 Transcript_33035/m.97466 type:complete len:246 (-) Transcript_33035:127-864(-)
MRGAMAWCSADVPRHNSLRLCWKEVSSKLIKIASLSLGNGYCKLGFHILEQFDPCRISPKILDIPRNLIPLLILDARNFHFLSQSALGELALQFLQYRLMSHAAEQMPLRPRLHGQRYLHIRHFGLGVLGGLQHLSPLLILLLLFGRHGFVGYLLGGARRSQLVVEEGWRDHNNFSEMAGTLDMFEHLHLDLARCRSGHLLFLLGQKGRCGGGAASTCRSDRCLLQQDESGRRLRCDRRRWWLGW